MNTKLSITCLSGLSLILSIGAFAVSGMADGYSDDLNWSYVNGVENKKEITSPVSQKPKEDLTCTEGCKSRPEADEFGLKLTYEDEAAPVTEKIKSYGPNDSYSDDSEYTQPIVKSDNPVVYTDNNPVVYTDNIVESKQTVQTTQQYPISVEYPITVQRDITLEQPVIVQQPVVMRRPVVLHQPITVQQQPQIIQKQPVVMQQQPMYIQQQPMYMQASTQPMFPAPFYGMPQTFIPQQPMQMPMPQQPVYQQPVQQMPAYISYPVQGQIPAQMQPAQMQSAPSATY